MTDQYKRNVAYKLRIGSLLTGKPILDADKFKFLELEDKHIARVNLIANIIDKYVQEGEKKFGSLTLDDGTGQIKIKAFGEEVDKFNQFMQGDTVMTIGLLRQWNNEVYLNPEILKKTSPEYLLVRKLEVEAEMPKTIDKTQSHALKDKLITLIKEAEKENGIDKEKIILNLKDSPEHINQEIKNLLEEGLIYEPRPNRLRWLG